MKFRLFRILTIILSFFFLTGFVPILSFVGPSVTVLTSGNVYKASAQFIINKKIEKETGKNSLTLIKETLVKEKEAVSLKLKELGVEDRLINLKGITQGMLVILGQKNIKKLSDFADLSSDELIGGFDEIKGKKIRVDGYLEEFSLSRKEADELIMAAREIAYK